MKKQIYNVFIFHCIHFLDFIIVGLSYMMPRRRNLWAFGNSSGYSDNARYLYEEVSSKHPEISSIWMCNKKEVTKLRSIGVRAYNRKSISGLWFALRAKVFIYSSYTFDISFPVSGGAFKVNLWHGAPIKEIEFLISGGPLKKAFDGSLLSRYLYPYYYQRPNILLTLGIKNTAILRNAFKVNETNCVSNIYPRCKIFLEDKSEQLLYLRKCGGIALELYDKLSQYDRTYIYMPTFRDAHPDFLTEAGFDFEELNEALKSVNAYLVIKVHVTTLPYLYTVKEYSNIYVVKEYLDAYPLLPFIDVLITDYSSVYFDVLYLRKDVILFPFDKERYVREDRPFVIDYEEDVKGKHIKEFCELTRIIKNNEDCHLSDEDYNYMIEMYASKCNKDLAEIIKQRINFN